jgi:hypothetical protein
MKKVQKGTLNQGFKPNYHDISYTAQVEGLKIKGNRISPECNPFPPVTYSY